MSAESPKHSHKSGLTVIRPQPYSDKTVIESVVDFIQDVKAYSQSTGPKAEEREKVQWLKFEKADVNDLTYNPDCWANSGNIAPLVLVLGYKNGVQVWILAGNGEAHEVLSMRQGPVKVFTFLQQPEQVAEFGNHDNFKNKRPLVAICDASSAGQPYCCVKLVSLRSGDEVHKLVLQVPVIDIKSNHRVLVVAVKEKLAVYDACQFNHLFTVSACYPCPGPHGNPFALGERWLAYSEKRLVPMHQSGGGMSGDGSQSYAATVISAAKTVKMGLTMFSQSVASSITGSKSPPKVQQAAEQTQPGFNGVRPGVITVIDTQKVRESQVSVREDSEGDELVAHFPAHASEPVYAMEFDPSGLMLLTADKLGHNFHLFRIMAHPHSCSMGAVHHLYTLYRGDTTAKVQHISFTADSRWVAVSTVRGTTHVFPVTPYGGSVNVRTHTSERVVNRASRFHRSAGLEEIPQRQSGRDSPVSASPSSSPRQSEHYRHMNAMNNNMGNPRLPPFPHATTVQPLLQVRQSLALPGLGNTTKKPSSGQASTQQAAKLESVCLAACFAKSRGWVAGSTVSRERDAKRAVDSLYVLSHTGMLVEHVLEPQARPGSEKVTDDWPLELNEIPRAQWPLGRSPSTPELRPPLHNNNPLIMAHQAVTTQTPSEETLTRQESRESLASDHSSTCDPEDEWLSQVEMITHLGPHRRLWMGPQFSFKTYQTSNTALPASSSSVLPSMGAEDTMTSLNMFEDVPLQSLNLNPARSSPVAMPGTGSKGRRTSSRHASGSDGSHGPSPTVNAYTSIEACSYESPNADITSPQWPEGSHSMRSGQSQDEIQQHLAEAMCEAPAKHGYAQRTSVEIGSQDNLSTSSGSASSAPRVHVFDGGPQTMDNVLIFPGNSDSTDTSQ